MRSFAVVTTICLCMLAAIFATPSVSFAEQKDAPAFAFTDKAGTKHTLADYEGKKVVVIDFWATWCGPCRRALPGFKDLGDEFKDNKKVEFIAMNLGEPTKNVLDYLKNNGLSELNIRFDKSANAWKTFGIEGIPHCIVVDIDGKIVHRGHPANKAELRRIVTALSRADNE